MRAFAPSHWSTAEGARVNRSCYGFFFSIAVCKHIVFRYFVFGAKQIHAHARTYVPQVRIIIRVFPCVCVCVYDNDRLYSMPPRAHIYAFVLYLCFQHVSSAVQVKRKTKFDYTSTRRREFARKL